MSTASVKELPVKLHIVLGQYNHDDIIIPKTPSPQLERVWFGSDPRQLEGSQES